MEKQQKANVRDMVEVALFAAIMLVLAFTPLGYIPITPTINATTMHIPVILAGIVLGRKKGAITGFIFGLTSFAKASFFTPNITSFLFTPLYPGGNVLSLVICFVPRILIGVVAALVFEGLSKLIKGKDGDVASLAIAGVCGSLTNTILVMGMAYLFFAQQFADAVGKEAGEVLGYIITGVVVGNGVPEAIVAGIITAGVGKALLVVNRKRNLQ